MEQDIKFVKTMLLHIKTYGDISWFENNKMNEILFKFNRMYPSSYLKI